MIQSICSLDMPLLRTAAGVTPFVTALIALMAVGCGGAAIGAGTPTPSSAPRDAALPKVPVVTTTSILADFVKNVGGDRVQVRSIVPAGADVHSFQSTPQDSIALSKARLIVSNGRGLDDFLEPLVESARKSDAVHVLAAEGLEATPMQAVSFQEHEGHGDGAVHAEGDPHFWQNPLYAVYYVERIRDGLIRTDPVSAQLYRENAASYTQRLRELDQEIAATLDAVPIQRRHLVTFHDAFGYFAERYGWRVSAFVPGDASDITPRDVIQVMERVEQQAVPAVFAEPQFSPGVMSQLSRDSGVGIATIYSDILDANVPTYIDMMRFNVNSLVEHLR